MAHYAKIENNIVTQVIVAEQDFIDTLPDKDSWIKTSYNTRGGVHIFGRTPLRKNYAGIGFLYDKTRDAFIPPKIYDSWILNENTCLWEPPIPYPINEGGITYIWDEDLKTWKEINYK